MTTAQMPGKILVLLRHGKSAWDDSSLADHERPLAKRGRRAARTIARHMREIKLRPRLVLCSSALRARETCQLIESALSGSPEVREEEGLYAASSLDLLNRLKRVAATVPSVIVIGHNPGLQELAELLAAAPADRGRLAAEFPTCAMATFEVPAWKTLGEGDGELIAMVLPRRLSRRG